jgi:hypothetical protein
MMTPFPNFFILGAAKAGTTTLSDVLRQHPQAYLPFDKEPMFFSRDAFYQNGFDWYAETYFKKADHYPARGDASPHYLYWADKVAPRINNHYQGRSVRFVVILRNPADRAYSWYWNMVREGLEDLSFEQAVAEEPERLRKNMEYLRTLGSMQYGYVYGGQYARQVSHFLQWFDRACFLFLLQEDLIQNYTLVCQQLFQFLDLDDRVQVSHSISNPAAMPRSRRMHQVLQGPSAIKALIKRLVPHRLRYQAKRALIDANSVKITYPPMQADTRKWLQNQFKDENLRLADLIDRDLSAWNIE